MLTGHMIQHLLLMTFGPPLIWLGAPVKPFLRSTFTHITPLTPGERFVLSVSAYKLKYGRADVTSIALIALSLAFLATLYPSWRASKVNPAEALRYE